MITLDVFQTAAQMQADTLYERKCYRPKEMIINPELRKGLNLGSSVTLNHVGTVPLVDEPGIPLFMFRGFTRELISEITDVLKSKPVILKGRSLGMSSFVAAQVNSGSVHLNTVSSELAKETKQIDIAPAKKSFIPMSKRKRAAR